MKGESEESLVLKAEICCGGRSEQSRRVKAKD